MAPPRPQRSRPFASAAGLVSSCRLRKPLLERDKHPGLNHLSLNCSGGRRSLTMEKELSINAKDCNTTDSLRLLVELFATAAGTAENDTRASTISPTQNLAGLMIPYLGRSSEWLGLSMADGYE